MAEDVVDESKIEYQEPDKNVQDFTEIDDQTDEE